MINFKEQINTIYGERLDKKELENQALGYIHIHNYKAVIDIMYELIEITSYENGYNSKNRELEDEIERLKGKKEVSNLKEQIEIEMSLSKNEKAHANTPRTKMVCDKWFESLQRVKNVCKNRNRY